MKEIFNTINTEGVTSMLNLIHKIFEVLNECKNFKAGYSGVSAPNGYMMIEYNNIKYAVRIIEMPTCAQKAGDFDALDSVPYYF